MLKGICTILGIFISAFLFSQTGPSGVGSSNNNVLWLKADAGASTALDNTPISYWNDQSGNSINVTQTISVQQPSFATNVINGFPAIQFDNTINTNDKLIGPDSPKLDNTSGYTFFTVIRPQNVDNNARTIISKRTNVSVNQSFMLFLFTGNKFYVDIQSTNDRFNTTTTYSANTNYILNMVYNGTLAINSRAKSYTGETIETTAAETSTLVSDNSSPLLIGTTDASDPRPFGGYIAEIITYTVALNDAQRKIVNNYLAAKYNIALSTNDKYSGDTPANGNYDREVAGIGKELSGSSNSFSASVSGGLTINSNLGLDVGDYLLAGHATNVNSPMITDVAGMTGTNNARWKRIWYFDITNTSTNLNNNIEFDMSDGGVTGFSLGVASDYVLLYRAGQIGNWTELSTGSSISGDRVLFNNINLTNDGYYTIGTKNYYASSLPIELINFNAILNGKKVDVTWATATESNNYYYTIEKSKDGVNFETSSIVDAAGNSLSMLYYKDVDANPYEGISYYRLKQTDFNGTFTYSKIVTVNYSISYDCITIFPNPTDGEININMKDMEGNEFLVVIRDILGKECLCKLIVSRENQQLIARDSEHKLASGTYIITASSNNKLCSQIIIVK
jgi:hypothetical protein